MLKSIKVRDYMTRHLVIFRPEMDLFTAINRLLEHGLAGAPVLDAEGQLVGILSEADCLRAILAGAYFDDAHGAVGSFMTVVPDTIDADADIITAAEGFLLDQRPFEQAALAVGQQDFGAVERAGGADFEGLGAGLFSRRVDDAETGAVDMFVGQISRPQGCEA